MTTPPVDQPLSIVRAAALGRTGPVLSTTPLGTVDAAAIADVDPAGWVQMRGATWSLDWWVGAEDRWHHPALEAAVRQRPLDDAPIIETAMRVPGGDVVHRAFGVRATSRAADDQMWDDSAVLVEIENSTAVPVALALAVRPLTLSGAGSIGSVQVDGSVVRVDGRVAAVVSRPVVRVAHGPAGQVADALAAGDDDEPTVTIAPVGAGRLEVALVVPLPHTAVVRVLLPRVVPRGRRRFFGAKASGAEPGATFDAPEASAIASGWAAHTRDIARVELGEPLLDRLAVAAPRSLVLGSGDHVIDRAERAVQVTELFARCGLTEPLGPLARAMVDEQRLGGAVRLEDGGDATAALLFAAAPLLATGSEVWQELLVGPVAKSVHLVRKGGALEHPSTWRAGAAALALVAPALRAAGQPEVAEDAEAAAALVLERAADRRGPTASGNGAVTAGGGPALDRLVELRAAIAAGDDAAAAELLELARLGEPGAMADRYDDQGVPAGTLGYDPGAVAARAGAAIDLAMLDAPEGPVVLPVWPDAWWGRSVEAHGVVTRFGRASFAVRWHGDRPALLWEVEPTPGVDPEGPAPVLSCPGLDPAWRGSGWTGEALLGAVAAPDGLVADGPPGPTLTPQRVDLPAPPSEGQSFL
jgi:hypothetical protein